MYSFANGPRLRGYYALALAPRCTFVNSDYLARANFYNHLLAGGCRRLVAVVSAPCRRRPAFRVLERLWLLLPPKQTRPPNMLFRCTSSISACLLRLPVNVESGHAKLHRGFTVRLHTMRGSKPEGAFEQAIRSETRPI